MEDIVFMQEAISLAREAYRAGEVPVGALVVDNATGEVLARAYNLRVESAYLICCKYKIYRTNKEEEIPYNLGGNPYFFMRNEP